MQQIFRLLIFLNQPNMFRATYSPILRSTFWLYIQLLVQCTAFAADRCHGWHKVSSQPWHRSAEEAVNCTKSCTYSQKLLLRMGEFVTRNMLGLKKINKRKSCCILLVVYIYNIWVHLSMFNWYRILLYVFSLRRTLTIKGNSDILVVSFIFGFHIYIY